MGSTRSGWIQRLALVGVVIGGSFTACTRDEAQHSESDFQSSPSIVEVEDPSSPALGAEANGPLGRRISHVEIWNDGQQPGVQAGARTVMPIEVTDENGDTVGFFSTCFPSDLCGPTLDDAADGCAQRTDGTDECLIENSSGSRYVVHIMDGPVTVAEARAAADLVEARST